MNTGYIAYFDILGFSQRIREGDDFIRNFDLYKSILSDAVTKNTNGAKIILNAFSDSVVLSVADSKLESFLSLCRAVSDIQFRLIMELSSPICGTISHGKYNQADEKNTTMITGRPLLEAIEFEKKQNWVGVMIAPSVIKAQRTLLEITTWDIHDPRELDKILKYAKYMCFIHSCNQIPFKNSPSYESLVIVPINSKHEQIRSISSSFSEYINELKYLRATAPSPYTQQKYDDSLDFLYDVSGDWMVTLRMEGFGPIHNISMWV